VTSTTMASRFTPAVTTSSYTTVTTSSYGTVPTPSVTVSQKRDSLLDDYPVLDTDYSQLAVDLGDLGDLGDEEFYYDTSEYNFDDSYYNKYDKYDEGGDAYMEDSYEDEEYANNKKLLAQLYGQQDSFESASQDVGMDSYDTDPMSTTLTTTNLERRPSYYAPTTTAAVTTSVPAAVSTTSTTAQQQQHQQQQQQSQLPFSSIPKPSLPNLGASLKSAAPMFGKFTSAMSSLGAAVSSVIPQPPGAVVNNQQAQSTTRTQRATLRPQESVDSQHFPEEPSMKPTLKREPSVLKRDPSMDHYGEHGQLTRESSMERYV
jgi:hypothetical protein